SPGATATTTLACRVLPRLGRAAQVLPGAPCAVLLCRSAALRAQTACRGGVHGGGGTTGDPRGMGGRVCRCSTTRSGSGSKAPVSARVLGPTSRILRPLEGRRLLAA